MDSSEKSNPSSSYSIHDPIMAEDENVTVVAAKRLKLDPSTDHLTSEGSDMAETGNMSVVLLSPNSSLSPEEKVLSIDHILESIFMRCDRQSLLNCRLVSHRWAYYGSKELQKSVSITFYDCFRSTLFERFVSDWDGAGGSMEDLIFLMNNSTEFPSTSFEFRRDESCQGKSSYVNMEEAQAFFNAHGASIKKMAFHQGLSLEDLKRLLLSQAPNLQQLYLGSIDIDIYTSSTELPSTLETEEQMSQRELRQESLFDETTSKPKPVLKNLKIFKCDLFLELPLIFIKQILECSPNLIHVALPCDYPHVLVQPTSLVHLPQVLNVYINNENIWSYELFANHLQDTNEKLAVRELYFRGTYCWKEEVDDDIFKEFSDSVAIILMRILKACSATCQQLVWDEGVHNLKIPQMPQVKHLGINYYKQDGETGTAVNSLLDGLSLGDTFPSLTSLEITSEVPLKNLPIANIFKDEDPIPASNVKTVTLRFPQTSDEKLAQTFSDMFPNAAVQMLIFCRNANVEFHSDSEGQDNEENDDGGSGDDGNDDEEHSGEENNDEENNDEENSYEENADDH